MRLETGISPNYVKGWTVAKALRELVQNWLDSKQQFKCGGSIRWKDGMAILKDSGPGIEPRHLALGVSEKGIAEKGKYGEGLKLALLVLAREGRRVDVQANGRIIRPAIVESADYQTAVLALDVSRMTPRLTVRHKGTSVKVQCTQEELETAKQYFIEFTGKGRMAMVEWLERGKISLPGGHIYVNGTLVGKVSTAMFSYHLLERQAGNVGNRDREVVSTDAIRPAVRQMLADTSSTAVMKMLLMAAQPRTTDGTPSWEIQIGLQGQIRHERKRIWLRVAHKVFGKSTLVNSAGEQAAVQARYQGYAVLRDMGYAWNAVLESIGMKGTSDVLQKPAAQVLKIARQNLTETERTNWRTAKKLVEKRYGKVGRTKIVARIPGETQVIGMYDRKRDVILIARCVLEHLDETVGTLLHEVVHKDSGASDLTPEYQEAMILAATKILLASVRHKKTKEAQ